MVPAKTDQRSLVRGNGMLLAGCGVLGEFGDFLFTQEQLLSLFLVVCLAAVLRALRSRRAGSAFAAVAFPFVLIASLLHGLTLLLGVATLFGVAIGLLSTTKPMRRWVGDVTVFAFVSIVGFLAYEIAFETALRSTRARGDRIVEAIERHKADTGAFPVQLEDLVPRWLGEIPARRLDMGPWRYVGPKTPIHPHDEGPPSYLVLIRLRHRPRFWDSSPLSVLLRYRPEPDFRGRYVSATGKGAWAVQE